MHADARDMPIESLQQTVDRIWRENKNGFASLHIDAFLETLSIAPRLGLIQPLEKAKRAARRTIEVACVKIEDFRTNSPAEAMRDFGTVAEKAAAANSALSALITRLDPRARVGADLETSIVSALSRKLTGNAHEMHAQAIALGVLLWDARNLARRIETAAAETGGKIKQEGASLGKPDQRIFVETAAECWIYLTGRRPGSNPVTSRNKFLQFTVEAWIDAFGDKHDDPAFIGGLRDLIFSDHQFQQIRAHGPFWL
jgi:hypothetical protein